MRTFSCVMVLFLFAACGAAFAQDTGGQASESLDRDITVIGRDDTAIPVPAPWRQREILLPDLDLAPPPPTTLPAIPPPAGDWSAPWLDPRTLGPLLEPFF